MARRETGEIGTSTGEGDRLQEAASGLADQAARTAEAQASTTMTRAGDTLEQVARAIRDAGNGMREEQPQIAGIADTAAQRVEEASRYLRDHQAGEVVDSVQTWAREQPALVIGGGLAIGLLLGRFLKSGSSSQGGGGDGRLISGYGKFYDEGGYAGRQSPGGYASSGSAGSGAAALGGGAVGLGGVSGYETSSAGYASGSDYTTGVGGADTLGTRSAVGTGSLGEASTAGTLDHTAAGYAALGEARDTAGLEPDVSAELQATDDAATETLDVGGEEGVLEARAERQS